MSDLTLSTTEKATITVDLDDGAGNVTPLGAAFHFSFDHPFASLESQGGVLFVVGQAVGDCILHLTTMDDTLPLDVPVSVTAGSGGGPHLVVTFGTPEPR